MTRTALPRAAYSPAVAPTVRDRIRRAFPLVDRVTYLIAAAVLAVTCGLVELAQRVGTALAGAL